MTAAGMKTMQQPDVNGEAWQKRRPTATNKDVSHALLNYYVIPIILFGIASACHNLLLNYNTEYEIIQRMGSSRILLLGFPSPSTLWFAIYERVVSVMCWGSTFLFVRKGWNPELRAGNFKKRWRGAALSTLMVFYSTFGRLVIKRNNLFCSSHACDALLVGICWGASSVLIRRRLDPALRDNLIRRCWKDVVFGSLSFAISYSGKHHFSHYKVPIKAFLQDAFPVDTEIASLFHLMFDISAQHFWNVAVDACYMSFWWSLTYLLIRRGCNPDSRATWFSKFGRDALYGFYALVVNVYLKLAVKKWLPLAFWSAYEKLLIIFKDDSAHNEL